MDFPSDPTRLLHNGAFTNGDPSQGIPSSADMAQDMNAVYWEVIALIKAAGLDPDDATFTQLRDAVVTLITDAGLSGAEILARLAPVGGAGSGLDADRLDGQHGDYYRNATNLATGTVPTARLPSGTTTAAGIVQLLDSVTSNSTGRAATANAVRLAYTLATTNGTKQTAGGGWWKCNDTGLMVQRGSFLLTGVDQTVQFPIAFPARCDSVILQRQADWDAGLSMRLNAAPSRFGFTCLDQNRLHGGVGGTCYFHAMGA